jgi:hypothetical protein
MWVENRSDELWLGVKGQSNWEIAGSLRNIFRYGLGRCQQGVEHCMDAGVSKPTKSKQTPNTCMMNPGRQEPCDNVRLREGKNPDRRLRSPSTDLVEKQRM